MYHTGEESPKVWTEFFTSEITKYHNMKTFYRIFGGKCRERALAHIALFSLLLISTAAISQPTATITGGGTICQGSTIDLNINFSGGPAPWRVVYSINGINQAPITDIYTTPYVLPAGTEGEYRVVEVYDGFGFMGTGSGDPATVRVENLPSAAGAISGSTTVCQSTNGVIYSILPVPHASSYTWSVPSGVVIASGANTNSITVNYSAAAASGNITVFGTNTCGSGASSSLLVTVSSLPAAAGSVSGPASVCQGQTGVVYSVAAIAGATDYEWNLPTGATISAGTNTNTITVSYSTTANSGVVRVRGNNSCGSGAWSPDLSVTVNPLPGNPGIITGSSAVCQGQTGVTYSVPAIALANGYEWSLPTGASIISGANTNQITVNFSTTAVSGDILVRGLNGCGAGQWSAAFAVTVSNLPVTPGNITGSATVCQNQTGLVFSVAPIAYAATYEWTYPAGFTVAGAANQASITFNTSGTAVSGQIRVRGINSCGNGSWSPDFNVTVATGPTASAGADNSVCGSNTIALSGSATNYSTVSWSTSGNGTFSNSGILNPVYTPGSADISAGSVTLTLTANGLGSCSPASDDMMLTIYPQPLANAGPDASI